MTNQKKLPTLPFPSCYLFGRTVFHLLQRFSSCCTALTLLFALLAAPYLIPGNPDSVIFRSSSLGPLLLGMCAFPVKNALNKHSPHTLLYGAALALPFSICLSLGSELCVYGQLLPGLGSLLRRIAVPCMAMPLFSCLFSYLFAYQPAPSSSKPIPYLLFFALFTLSYSAVLLALYPGVISYDFQHEIKQFTEGIYQAAHPVFHTLFLGGIYSLGEALFGSMTAGAALYSVIQLLLLAALYAWACTFVQRRIPNRIVILVLSALFAFLPVHGVLAVSTAKDPLFSGICTVLCLLIWEIAETPEVFLKSPWHIVRFAAVCLGIALLRHNGVFAYIPACIALLFLLRTRRSQSLAVIALSLALALVIPRSLEFAVGATKTPSSEMMSVPCQQLMRTTQYADLSEEEFAQIERWFPDATHTYRPHCADPAKGGNFNYARYQKQPMDFWTTYAKYALKYPRVYFEAFLENCIGLWYPDDISHAHSLSNEEWAFIYMNTTYPFAPETYPIEPDCKFPALQKILYASTHYSQHQKIPVLSLLFCPATYTFLLLLTTLLLFFHRKKRFALCTLPLWGIFLSLLFSAGIFIRYAYPLMTIVPLLFALAFFGDQKA